LKKILKKLMKRKNSINIFKNLILKKFNLKLLIISPNLLENQYFSFFFKQNY
jgi:hypothetical protein